MAINKLVIASGNQDKLSEIRQFFTESGANVDVLSIKDFDADFDPEETGTTFAQNALIKAKAAIEKCGAPVLADDTGLKVKALYGAPGVHSARYAGKGASYQDNCEKLLKTMKGYRAGDRDATFVCHMTLLTPEGRQLDVEGKVEGEITNKMAGDQGFGYDPIFFLKEKECTMAEISLEEKNKISHRAKAMQSILDTMRKEGLL